MSVDAAVPTRPPAILKDRLNVVGERHTESDLRREAERAYTTKIFGPDRYWQEYEFPDRLAASQQGQQWPTKELADFMDLRALFGTAFALSFYEPLARTAAAAPKAGVGSPLNAVLADIETKLADLEGARKRTRSGWRNPETSAVQKAVDLASARLDALLNGYRTAAKDQTPGWIPRRIQAAEKLALGQAVIDQCLDSLAAEEKITLAAGPGKGTQLWNLLSDRRSLMMVAATQLSPIPGIWKIGDRHVQDILTGKVKARVTNRAAACSGEPHAQANYITHDQFTEILKH
ncbi:hypothetical protein LWF15_18800 [Kineosporia rhizophila]|uniref:hypothetical protein n=1 Tax=Kineosporia rhizophila TaxID=84633 RepID=UPI001E2DFE43|nr:hypothetical protein [Kineosporia rhizophila]MCE0537541.1 hypothetical protein [Kineosporia rhizophila]